MRNNCWPTIRTWPTRNIAPGIANYVIGSQSAGSRFALWFGGIHGDKKLGMEQIAQTAQGGHYLRPFARILLALAARRENQNALAQKSLLELEERYPDHLLFASEYAKPNGAYASVCGSRGEA